MSYSERVKSIQGHMFGKMVWLVGNLWVKLIKLKKVFYNLQRKFLRLKRKEAKYKLNLKKTRNNKIREKKIKTKLLKIRIKTLWLFYKQLSKIFYKKPFIKLRMVNGTFLTKKKESGFNRIKNQLKECKRWKKISLINSKAHFS